MPKREPTSLACPLCLVLDEPGSMIDVAIERANPPDSVYIALCRRCAYAIVHAVAISDQPDPTQALGSGSTTLESSAPAGSADAPADVPEKQDG